MVATPILANQETAAADNPAFKPDETAAVPQPEFSVDFPKEEENGDDEDEFLVMKHSDKMYKVKAKSVEEAMTKVLAEDFSIDVEQLAEHITVDCDGNMGIPEEEDE